MRPQSWTVVELLNTTSSFLAEKGIESPRRNAELMLGKVLVLPRVELYLQYDRPLKETELAAFRELVRRRSRREPLQQILGVVEFCGLTLDVPPGVLIPRPETEELVAHVVREIRSTPGLTAPRVLDLGCGSGCIAVALAVELPNAQVDAVDVDYEALRCTAKNAERHGVSGRVRTIRADVLDERFIAMVSPPYDVVISNPPYVTDAEYTTLAPEVRDYEPRHALAGGKDGMRFYRRIAELTPTLLRPGGMVALEIGADQSDAVLGLLRGALGNAVVHADMAGLPRIIMGVRPEETSS